MNLINNANATTQASTPSNTGASAPPAVDMNSIVDRITQNNSPLTPQQREDMVNSVLGNGDNANALTSFKNAADNTEQWKEQLDQSHNALDYLQQLQREQDEKVQELNRRLQPLSPTGTIPGLHDFASANQDPFDNISLGMGSDYDPNAFINFDDPQPWDNAEDGNGDFNFDFSDPTGGNQWDGTASGFDPDASGDLFGAAQQQGNESDAAGAPDADADGLRVQSVSGSEATSPAPDGNSAEQEQVQGSAKRARRS